ncbi:MAG: DUF6737 family protein [Prochlorococcaceae cyanobacterium]
MREPTGDLGPEPDDGRPLSIWLFKPWWCQPWSIVLTGIVVIGASWVLVHRLWITVPVAAAVLLWWVLFLGLVPAAYRDQMARDRAECSRSEG